METAKKEKTPQFIPGRTPGISVVSTKIGRELTPCAKESDRSHSHSSTDAVQEGIPYTGDFVEVFVFSAKVDSLASVCIRDSWRS